jgi:hypothetical protein
MTDRGLKLPTVTGVRSWWPLLAVAALLVAVGTAAAVATPQLTRVPVPEPAPQPMPTLFDNGPTPGFPSPSTTRSPRAAQVSVPGWLLPLLTYLILAIIVAVLVSVVWLVVRNRARSRFGEIEEPRVAPVQAAAEDVVAAVDAGLSDLSDTDLDPRRAVIACWVRLEQVAAGAGTPRQVSDTPTDLVTRLLAAHFARGRSELASPASPSGDVTVDAAVLAEFADIYRAARYATHAVDEQMRGQARAALERVRSALTGVPV